MINHHIKGRSGSRFGLSVVAVLIICAAVAFGAVELTRSSVQPDTETLAHPGSKGPLAGPTIDRPMLAPSARQVSMAQATTTFGSPVALPDTSAVQPSDVRAVWTASSPAATSVAVTFPSKQVFVIYGRPAPSDPATLYKGMATALLPDSDFVQLNGTTPAVYATATDGSGTNWIEFATDTAAIRIYGNHDEATLEAIAQSILTRLTTSSSS